LDPRTEGSGRSVWDVAIAVGRIDHGSNDMHPCLQTVAQECLPSIHEATVLMNKTVTCRLHGDGPVAAKSPFQPWFSVEAVMSPRKVSTIVESSNFQLLIYKKLRRDAVPILQNVRDDSNTHNDPQ
jgi:hypothetical protein